MAKVKLNISMDENVLNDVDRVTESEDRPSRSNTIESLVKRGMKKDDVVVNSEPMISYQQRIADELTKKKKNG